MRLFEAVIDANRRAARGEAVGLRQSDFADSLPVVALTCIDTRLNPLLPEVLGISEEHFIWLRNAGNIITGPMSSMMRSVALACAVKGGREIAVIGHTDCRVKQTSASELIDRFRALGIDRSKLPDNVHEFFGLFASERANVLKAVDYVRQSPLIGSHAPVHGLLVDIRSGELEWLVDGYRGMAPGGSAVAAPLQEWKLPAFELGEMKFPEVKIGEVTGCAEPVPAAESPSPKLKVVKVRPPESSPVPPRILLGPRR